MEEKKDRKQAKQGYETVRTVFGGEGLEPITEEVIADLAKLGWPEQDLRWAAKRGARYSRQRHSVVFPPEES